MNNIQEDKTINWKKNEIPYLYINTYTNTVENCLLVYNPLSAKGITVLNAAAACMFKLVNNKRSLYDIYLLIKKHDTKIRYAAVKKVFDGFSSSDIIFFGKEKLPSVLFQPFQRRLEVWFHITNQCNLRCKYCYIKKTPEHMSDETAKNALEKIMSDAAKHKFVEVTIKFSGGECLLEFPRLVSLIDFGRRKAKEYGIEINFSMLTNGTLITKKAAKIIKDNKIEIGVSIDGFAKYHNKQRVFADGSGSYKYVEKGIRNLQEEHVKFHVMITITSLNIIHLPQFIKYLLQHNIRFIFNLFHENPYAEAGLKMSNKVLVKYFMKVCDVIYSNPPKENLISDLFDGISFMVPHTIACGAGLSYMVIRHDGKIAICATSIDNSIGSIDDDDIIETMFKGYPALSRISLEKKPICRTCQWKYICCGGCPLSNYNRGDAYKTRSQYCSVYKAIIPKLLQIEAKRMTIYSQ